MLIDPAYDKYFVYSSVYKDGKLFTSGACPLIWQDKVVLQGGEWKKGLTWADGNYHLYEGSDINNDDAQFVEESIFTALNESEDTYGKIEIDDSNFVIRWCLMEEEQINIVMDLTD